MKENRFILWLRKIKPSKRKLIQLYVALLYNANIKGFISGNIFKGNSKTMCVPGLNCYSCPGAIGACPLGSLQNGLSSMNRGFPFYIFGIIMLYGLILGRTICGFLCPMGLLQELIYKIKTPKINKNSITRMLSYFKYILLVVLVFIIPVLYGFYDVVIPGFCKYVCPAGIVEGAFGLLSNPNNVDFFQMLGSLFTWKFVLLIGIATMCVFMYRFFCRFLCPLGAIYGFFNKFSFLGITVNNDKCTNCGLCVKVCKMDVKKVGDHECINCGECISVCHTNAITWKGSKLFLHENQIDVSCNKENIEIPNNKDQKEINNKPKPKKWFKITSITLASSLLVGVLVYANFIDGRNTSSNENPSSEVSDSNSINDGPIIGNEIGNKCIDATLPIYGKENDFSLSSHNGKVVIINFWATYCGPCVLEIPHFEKIQNEYKDDVYVVAIHHQEQTEDVAKFINKKWSNYNIDFAQDEAKVNYYEALGGKGTLPMTVIVNQERIITNKYLSSITYESLKTDVDSLLNK